MGGALARPADRFPDLFGGPFWKAYPYFLPSGMAALVVAVTTIILYFFLEEVGRDITSTGPRDRSPDNIRPWPQSANIDVSMGLSALSSQIQSNPYPTPSYRYPFETSSYRPSFIPSRAMPSWGTSTSRQNPSCPYSFPPRSPMGA